LRSIPENPWHEIAITLAGPMVNAAIACAVIPFTGIPSHLFLMGMPHNLHGLLLSLAQANITLFLFNLIPAFPMDGGRLLRAVLALVLSYRRATTIAAMVGQGLAIVFVLIGLRSPQMWLLIIIGAFIFMGAEGEERIVRMRSVLHDLDVEDVMSREFAVLSPADPIARGVELIYQTGQDDFPVVQEGKLAGMVTRPALVEAMNARTTDVLIGQIMNPHAPVVSPREKVVHVYEEIINGANTSAVVMDGGRIIGMISPDNISRYLLVQSSIKSSRRRSAGPVPPLLATSQTPMRPPVISGVHRAAVPPPHEESVPRSDPA
jgi:stage IV sporulation protein FB